MMFPSFISAWFYTFESNSPKVEKAFNQAELILKSCYLFLAFNIFSQLNYIYRLSKKTDFPSKLWSVTWLSEDNLFFTTNFCALALFLTSVLLIFWLHNNFLKILNLVFFVIYLGVTNSFGKINHGLHLFFPVLFIHSISFLNVNSITKKIDFLEVFKAIQFLVLLCYSMSGFYKLYNGFIQLSNNQISIFSIYGLPNTIARRLMDTNSTSLLGDFFIRRPLMSFIFYSGAIFLELFSVLIINKRSLHKIWGFSLAMMHLSIVLTMTIAFKNSTLLVLLLFGLSPFYQYGTILKGALEIPWIGDTLSILINFFDKLKNQSKQLLPIKELQGNSHFIVFYDGNCGVCNELVKLLYKFKLPNNLYLSKINGSKYKELVARDVINPCIDSIVVYRKSKDSENSFYRSSAMFNIVSLLKSPISYVVLPLMVLPTPIYDLGYLVFAKIRKRLIAYNHSNCLFLDDNERFRFVE